MGNIRPMAAITVIHVQAVPEALRGTLSRWMLEPIAGTFVGPLPARVRDHVWKMVTRNHDTGSSVMIHPADNEQGFAMRTCGENRRSTIDFDGINLIAFT